MSKKPLPSLHIADVENIRLLLAESYRHNEYLQQQLNELKVKRFFYFNDEEHWLWDADGNNYLDSLVCPVLISASDMRNIRDAAKDLVVESSNLPDSWDTASFIEMHGKVIAAEKRLMSCFNDEEVA